MHSRRCIIEACAQFPNLDKLIRWFVLKKFLKVVVLAGNELGECFDASGGGESSMYMAIDTLSLYIASKLVRW